MRAMVVSYKHAGWERDNYFHLQKIKKHFCKYKLHIADAQGTHKGRQGMGRKNSFKEKPLGN